MLLALLEVAGERDWCRPSKVRLCEMSGYALGSVKRALMRLESREYFSSEATADAARIRRSGHSYVDHVRHLTRRRFYVDHQRIRRADIPTWIHATAPMIHELVGIQEHSTDHRASEAGASWAGDNLGAAMDLPHAASDDTGWAALLDTYATAPPPLDPAALAAWELEDGLCAISPADLPEVQEAENEEAAIAADEVRILAYRAARAAQRTMPPAACVEPPSTQGEAIAFPGGASFDPNAGCMEPFDLDAHWAQMRRNGALHAPDGVEPPLQPRIVFVARTQIDPDHRRRISELTSKAQFCRHKATIAASRAQRRWARREAERLSFQVQALKAEQIAVSAEYAQRIALRASAPAAPAARPPGPVSPAFSAVQITLFHYVHEPSIAGRGEEWKRRGRYQ